MIANPSPKIWLPYATWVRALVGCVAMLCLAGAANAQETRVASNLNRPSLRVAGGKLDPYVPWQERPAAINASLDLTADSWPGVIPTLEITRTLSGEIAPVGYDDDGSASVLPISSINTSEGEQIYPYDFEVIPGDEFDGLILPEPRRNGAFQESSNQFDYISKNGMGQMSFTASALFGMPAPTRRSPLLFKPLFQVMWLDGPTVSEMPARLYESSLQVQWLNQINSTWATAISVTPGLYGDYKHVTSDAFRLPGYAGVRWSYSPTFALAFGVAYYDRIDVGWVPVAGVFWQPTPDLVFDLIPPKPRASWRFSCHDCTEKWLYVGGEFGGGSWQIERTGGVNDQVAIRDYRLLLGIERKKNGWPVGRFEVGYVFGREIEYASSLPDVDLGDSFMFRSVSIF